MQIGKRAGEATETEGMRTCATRWEPKKIQSSTVGKNLANGGSTWTPRTKIEWRVSECGSRNFGRREKNGRTPVYERGEVSPRQQQREREEGDQARWDGSSTCPAATSERLHPGPRNCESAQFPSSHFITLALFQIHAQVCILVY